MLLLQRTKSPLASGGVIVVGGFLFLVLTIFALVIEIDERKDAVHDVVEVANAGAVSNIDQRMKRYGAKDPAADKKVPEDYYMNYYCSAYIESVKWWFQNNMKISPEELAAYFARVTV